MPGVRTIGALLNSAAAPMPMVLRQAGPQRSFLQQQAFTQHFASPIARIRAPVRGC
jgi:hypothetical protein